MSHRDKPLVWLPFDPSNLGDTPEQLRVEQVDLKAGLPESISEVEVFVPPFIMGSRVRNAISQMTSLRIVQTLTAGVDSIRSAVPAGVTLCNGRGIHDTSTAELAVTLILSSLRGIPGFVRDQDNRAWNSVWRPALADKRVLLIGYGSIGRAIEARLTPFECEVVRVARSARDGIHTMVDLPDLLPDADVVVLIVPLTSETRGMVDAKFFARMKQGALLVNVARGPVVDTIDLADALRSRRITAAVDVTDPEPLTPDSPLYDVPGLLISPHVGGASSAMWPRVYRLVREQLARIAVGEQPINAMAGEY
ncbi:2-hydroxyacid dehydrogenase [Mycobacterium sp. GA-2829]|uniref:2-hydroxyacid dehydrogenase n=1 Tax=Mycobacterium sp. GA-2829 TaxID=1772283 RepID=UPI0007401C8D|nr:2-hydroxyacid dehydrogenase [Mycobacterium sp. GA-2829]KUI36471.1 dihydrofolate reductase [Mycobacterium sp. GA-2829]